MKKKIIALAMAAVMLVVVTVGATVAWLTAESDEVTNTFVVGNIKIKLDEAKVNYEAEGETRYAEFPGYYSDDSNSLEILDYVDASRVQENVYELTPGSTYFKDPKVTVLEGSERCYVFVKVTESNNPLVKDTNQKIVDWTVNEEYWELVPGTENVYYFCNKLFNNGSAVVDVNNFSAGDNLNFRDPNSDSFDAYLGNQVVGVDENGEQVRGVVLPTIIEEAKITIPDKFEGIFRDDSDYVIENPELPELKFDAYAIQADNMESFSIEEIWLNLADQLRMEANSGSY